jgi:hypothetical protein
MAQKLLGSHIQMTQSETHLHQAAKNSEVELVLRVSKQDCDEGLDVLRFSFVLPADFDHDGIAELLIRGFRRNQSESCLLGAGNA